MRFVPLEEDERKPQGLQFFPIEESEEPSLVDRFLKAAEPEAPIKRIIAAGLEGVVGAPFGIESAARAIPRQIATGELPDAVKSALEYSELYQLGRKLFGREPTPEELKAAKVEADARKAKVDRYINENIPRIPGLEALAKEGSRVANQIRESVSPEALEAMRGSKIEGNLIEAFQNRDFSKLSFGDNPTMYGYLLQGADVFGSLFPVVIAASVGAPTAAITGGGTAAAEGAKTATDFIANKTDVELVASSPYYKSLRESGVSELEARQILTDRAAEQAAFLQGSVATVGGAATAKLVSGAADAILNVAGKKRLGRIALGGAIAGAEEGTQEFLEGVASDLGINREVVKEIGEDSFANFVLGFIGGAPVGAARGAIEPLETPKKELEFVPLDQEPKTPAAPVVTPPVVPPTPEDEVLPGMVGATDIDQAVEGEEPPPLGVTPPVVPPVPPAPAAVTPEVIEPTVKVTPPKAPGLPPELLAPEVEQVPEIKTRAQATFEQRMLGRPAPISEEQAEKNRREKELALRSQEIAKTRGEGNLADLLTGKYKVQAQKVQVTELPQAAPNEPSMPIQKGSVSAIPMSLLTSPEALQRAAKVLAVPESDPDRVLRDLDLAARRGGLAEWEARAIAFGKDVAPSRALPDGLLVEDADFNRIDFGKKSRQTTTVRNSFLSKTGKGRTLTSLVEDGFLNDFLTDPILERDVYDPDDVVRVRNGVDEIIERIENNDFLSNDAKLALGAINEDIRKLERELTTDEINARLAEIAQEERDREAQGIAPEYTEADLARASAFEAREPTPEEKRLADLERDLFRLTPPPTPERTTPPGMQTDLFGARGMEAQPERAQPKAELTPIEREAKPKPKSFLAGLVSEFGYKRLDIKDPRTYRNKTDKPFVTFEKDGVRIAFEPAVLLYVDDRERVGMYMGDDNDMMFAALLVDPQERRKGKATQALKDVINMADEVGKDLYMEPASLDAGAMSTPQLKEFYKRFGFEPQKIDPPSGKVMIRKAGEVKATEQKREEKEAKPTREEQAAINRARQAEQREAAKAPDKKLEAEKEKVRGQLKLFEESPISSNEDNPAGEAARRDAVSTVDDLQSTNTPLALALSKDYAARQRVSLVGQTISNHEDLAVLSQVYRHPNFETVRMFFVNDAGEVVSQIGVSSRLPGSSSMIIGDSGQKYVERLQAAAKQAGATGVWMLHNHPSGNPKPSNADISLTKTIAKSLKEVPLKGHIVIDTNKYSVINPDGSKVTLSKDMSQEDLVKYDPRTYEEIFEPISIAKKVDENPESMVIVILNQARKVTGISTVDNAFFKGKTTAQIRRALYKLTLAKSGSRIMVASRDLDALIKVGTLAEDGVYIEPNGQYKTLNELFRRTAFLFPAQRPGVITADTSKLFDFLRIPKARARDASYLTWPDMRQLLDKATEDFVAREPQVDMFEDANKNPPKIEVKLPPGRSRELAELAQKIQTGEATREEYDAAVNKHAPVYVFTSAKKPATEQQMSDALNVVQREKIDAPIPDGTRVGARLDIDAKRKHNVAVVAIHEAKPKVTSPAAGRALSYRSTAMLKNVQFAIGNEEATLDIAAGRKKNSLQTMEGTLVNMSPEEAYRKAEQAMTDPQYFQVGFDPIRHSYFYDRVTTIPVVRADEVIQIGDMVLAKNPQFARKDQFLFNIDEPQGDLFSEGESNALKKTEDAIPGAKVVTKNRSPELTAAAELLRRGEITKQEYEEAVQRYSPVSVYAEPPKPASNAQVESALDANKKKYANINLESGTRVGLRLDIPAWENRKTWVVAIHKPKPKVTSPKALENLSYRSVAALKNVVFGVGDQSRTLNIAAGEFKDKLQTMEGEYVNISPEEALRRAQELIKDPSYIQVGFNPTRHAYFYDRRTMVPVVAAEEVLQIGNFILAKNPTFGKKDDFLFSINTPPDDGKQASDDFLKELREEAEAKRAIERKEKLVQYAAIRRRKASLDKKIRDYGTTIETQRLANNLEEIAKELREDIRFDKAPTFTAENFLRQARAALDGTTPYNESVLSEDVFAVIQAVYMDDPKLLEGLRLSVKPQFSDQDAMIRRAYKIRGAAGSFQPFTRLVSLYTGTKGVSNPETIRHELCHSLEQMMTTAQRELILKSYFKALEKAVKSNTDKRSAEFFDKVIDYLNDPTEKNRAEVSRTLPSKDFYQYVNPSEYWAVNAEKLMAQRLGTPWQRFKKAVRKIYQKLKDLFGFNPDYVVHQVFDQIMSGSKKRLDRESLSSYLDVSGYNFDFLENIDDDQKLVDKYKRPNTPMLDATPIKTAILETASYGKEFFKDVVTNPGKAINTLFTSVDRGILYLRNKNIWFGSGLNAADFRQYNGALRTGEGIATASVALDNMIRGGNIAVQVVTRGGIKFNKDAQVFVAVDTEKGMTGVYKAEAKLKEKLGAQLGTDISQGYREAKRSRSIQNEYYDRQAEYEESKELLQGLETELRILEADPKTSATDLKQAKTDVKNLRRDVKELKEDFDNVSVAFEKINMTDEEIDEFIDRERVHPELREIMDNWTAVNQNLLKFWRQVGLLSEKRYNTLSNIKDYVPWYRIMADEEDIHSSVQSTTKSATNIGKEKLFKKGKPTVVSDFVAEEGQTEFRIQPGKVDAIELNGTRVSPSQYNVEANGKITFKQPLAEGDLVVIVGVREIENITDNMTRNVMRMTMNGLRQYAAQRIVSEYATRDADGKIMTFPSEDRDKGRFNFIANGRRVVVEIRDPLIAEAAIGMEKVGMEMWKPLAAMANFTRRTITLSPVFQAKQVFKDAPTAAIVTGVKNPFALIGGVYKGFADGLLKTDPAYDILRAAGIGGFYSPARTPEAEVKREIGIINKSSYDYVIKSLDHIGDASDMAQRIATYNRVMAETGDQAQALYQAANVINFMRHGSGQVAQALFKTVPFLNAYANSTDVLFQSLAGGGLKGVSRQKALQRLLFTGTLLSATTILYCMLVGDDEEYNKLDDQTKLRGYMIPGTEIMLPMNTSAAFFFKAIPEMIYNKVVNEGTETPVDNKRLRTALKEAAVDMLLGPSPIPSAAKPIVEITLNRDFFTGRPLTPKALEALEAERQFTYETSEAAKSLSALTSIPGTENRVINPIEADHLIRGFFGSAGAMAAWSSNVIGAAADARVAPTAKQSPIIGPFLRPKVPRGPEDLFYDLKERTETKHKTFEDLLNANEAEKALEYAQKYPGLIVLYDYTNQTKAELDEMNELIRMIGRSTDKSYSAEQRRKDIETIQRGKQEMLKGIELFRQEAFKGPLKEAAPK